ncbi:hypothetical protein [Arthrobacter sp. H20]|uniref:hypothetical protein n=1 Tax=Arthrobacter sp. H20 TaxID=1267981 RepID=UPI0004798A94|nr:hypothetical protein [Arthrobacter sp. H20]
MSDPSAPARESQQFGDEVSGAIRQSQTENARLWRENEEVMRVVDGVEPAMHVHGKLQNPRRKQCDNSGQAS